MDTGDVVLHHPTGEKWVVAFVKGDRLAWCGWPEGTANVSDCELITPATPEERLSLLRQMAAMQGPDMRKTYALDRLEEAERSLPMLY